MGKMTRDHAKFTPEDHRWMRRALSVARESLFLSNPNPRVGCVLVREGHWLAEGFTQQSGSDHAEIDALNKAKQQDIDVVGATAYVTLEPCSHTGRTGPCTDAIIAAGIKRVVMALTDPNPQVSGRGIKKLQAAGIQVDAGLFAEESLQLNPGFCKRMTSGLPWVWIKSATSLDGFTAMPDGHSQWITGIQARDDGHKWRARACVVLTGIGTVLADNPVLNVRSVKTRRQPIRAVLDTQFLISDQAQIFNGDPVWIFTCKPDLNKTALLASKNARVIVLPQDKNGSVSLVELFKWFGQQEINEVHVEAGPRLQGAIVANDMVDYWVNYTAPSIIGTGQNMATLPKPITSLEHAYKYKFVDSAIIGADVCLQMVNEAHWQSLKNACGV